MQSDIGAIFHEAAVRVSKQELEELVANISRQLEAAGPYGVTQLAQEINRRNEKKYTPLHTALFFRNLDAIEVFIDLGADVNLKCHGTPSIHLAIMIAALPGGLDFGSQAATLILTNSCDLTAKDDQGYTALHCAAQLNLSPLVGAILTAAAAEGSEILLEARDRVGQRPLHRCAEHNSVATAQVLVSAGSNVNAATGTGTTPLHLCGAHGSVDMWKLLVESGADMTLKDIYGRTAVECAVRHGWAVSDHAPSLLHRIPSLGGASGGSQAAPIAATALLTHPLCMEHFSCPPSELETSSEPPENVRRLTVLLDGDSGALRCCHLNAQRGDAAPAPLLWVEEARPAAMSDVLRVHEWSHVRRVQYVCDGCDEDADAEPHGMAHLDGDTAISKRSFEAALRGAGSVCEAVDMVMSGTVRNAFCAVRPPGHHAGPRGLCQNDDGENEPDSHGFCLLNNISIGAAYAMNKHREKIHRVAIVDFDVHHGNGTEETVRWLRPGIDSAPILAPFGFGSVHTPRFKPWFDSTDADNVLFVSVHGFGPRERGLEAYPQACFYPGTGRTVIPELSAVASGKQLEVVGSAVNVSPGSAANEEQEQEVAVAVSHAASDAEASAQPAPDAMNEDDDDDDDDDDSDFDPDMSLDGGSDAPDDYMNASKRYKYVLPKVQRQFETYDVSLNRTGALSSYADPLILDVGVGLPSPDTTNGSYRHQWRDYFRNIIFPRLLEFKPDVIMLSAGFDAHKKDTINSGYIALVEEDYEWLTRNLMHIANTVCEGRVISALEGGYQISGEFSSAFARSVKAHVSCLTSALVDSATYSTYDAALESQYEAKVIEDIRIKQEQKQLMIQRQREAMRQAAIAAAREQQQQQQLGGDAGSVSEPPADAEVQSPSAEESGRKRRRAAAVKVDYAQLDKEMREREAAEAAAAAAASAP